MPQLYFIDGRLMTSEEIHKRHNKTVISQELKTEIKELKRDPLQCPYCYFIAKNKVGLSAHIRHCKKKVL